MKNISFKDELKRISDSKIKIGVVGYPSKLGGADTELDHQIRCWQAMGVEVHLCHTGFIDDNLKAMKMEDRNCIIHKPEDWESLEGLHVISFCNGSFLDNIKEIKKYAKTTTFVNCMTWNFPKEIKAQQEGLLDFHLYQSDHQFKKVSAKLKKINGYRPIRFQPYFHTDDFKFKSNRDDKFFNFGRISRGDADKYGENQLWIYETMTAPVLKRGTILGWDDRAHKKFGINPPDWIKTYHEGGITQQQLYDACDVIIMQTATFENMPRVGMEAMACGSVLVVDNRGGWRCLVENGKTGWLCDNERDFAYKASRIAHEKQEKEDMRIAARQKLEKEWGLEASMKSWENVFKQWEKIS
jgi:glycosyltransferase involved in cell wall biosynthesis